jgi:succinate dehydrogenase / fumarate reductase cytochrome b subunit
MAKARPKHLNLFVIKQPITAIASIMHRVSGMVLFLFIPLFLWLLQRSIASPESFAALKEQISNPILKILLFALLWGYLHHFFAGLKHLAFDVHVGADIATAKIFAVLVLVFSIGLTLLAVVTLW